jgi:molecular chaperone DnaK (HSP70)
MSVQPNVTQKIVVSIDFGTSRSGYAYNITGKQTFVANNWPLNYPKQYCKTWTQTLYKLPKGAGKASPVAFGGEAIQQLAEMDEEEAKGYELVKFFKMKLHNNPSGLYVGSSGYEFQAIDLVVDYLSFMHEQVMTELSSNIGSSPSPDEILWCLTIPAIWKEEEKAIMKQAAFKAGIISSEIPTEEEFLLILEPEGAAAYCLEIMSHQGTAMNEDDTFLILDCGGGTVDLTSHKISNGRLSELTTGSGGACGSSVLDANFWKILESISSEEVINNFKRECPKGVAQISSAWEQAKSTVKNLKTLTFVELAYDSLALVDVLGQQCPIFASRGGSKHIKLVISNITAIFEPVLKDIITLVNDQFNAVIEAQGKPFDYLFIVGGMGGSPLLIDVIKREFGSKINRSIQSVFVPGEAVVKGATLLGLDPSLIIARKMRQTYGMEATVEFKDGEHDVTKRVELLDKSGYYCKHYFDKFVEIKQTVDNVHAVARTYKVQSARQKSMALSMYTTLDPNPLYIDQRGVSKLGKLIIDMSDLTGGIDRSVTVKTYFGKSDIKIEAVQSNNPTQRYNATFKFDTSLIEYNGVEEEEIKYHM